MVCFVLAQPYLKVQERPDALAIVCLAAPILIDQAGHLIRS
jgi:hypothetical protein